MTSHDRNETVGSHDFSWQSKVTNREWSATSDSRPSCSSWPLSTSSPCPRLALGITLLRVLIRAPTTRARTWVKPGPGE